MEDLLLSTTLILLTLNEGNNKEDGESLRSKFIEQANICYSNE